MSVYARSAADQYVRVAVYLVVDSFTQPSDLLHPLYPFLHI
jgi:hypothetical protein